ncbi:hypothetical protein L6452_05967 [Arctium lappa]|uniref:Uncharacterized protein n=1 Tax=Arctium lappa TaxID=4217 RepID=A0ACB9EI66_ARCLA|nr:hypothetical protein L6452_05967 [Arctium lappa]
MDQKKCIKSKGINCVQILCFRKKKKKKKLRANSPSRGFLHRQSYRTEYLIDNWLIQRGGRKNLSTTRVRTCLWQVMAARK